jgi:hypothetical protein
MYFELLEWDCKIIIERLFSDHIVYINFLKRLMTILKSKIVFRILKAPASLLKIPKNAKSIIPVSTFTIWTAKTTPTKVRAKR